MEKEEILKALKLIGYDRKKHKDVKEALIDFLKIDKYANVMRGIVTNDEDLNTVQDVMKYYKKLKEIDIDEINQLLEEEEKKDSVSDNKEEKNNTDEFLESIIYDYRNKSFLKVKNSITKQYETVLESDKITNHKYYVTTKDGIYNFIGKKLFGNHKKNRIVTDKILEVTTNNDEIIYLSIDGKHIIKEKDYGKLYNNIIKILSSSELDKSVLNSFFDCLIKGKKLDYLTYNIESIVDNYVYCFKNNEITYFKINGDKIITTEDCIYPVISNLANNNQFYYERHINSGYKVDKGYNSHVIIVGAYDNQFKIKYGLYDLDLNKEILDAAYNGITRFDENIAIGYDNNGDTTLLLRKNSSSNVESYNMQSQFEEKRIHIKNICDCIKLSDDSYAIIGSDSLHKNDTILVINNISNIPKLAYVFNELLINYTYMDSLKSLIFTYDEENNYTKIVDDNGYCDYLNLRYVMEHLDGKLNNGDDISYQKLPKNIQNSNYILPLYKEESKLLMCLSDKSKSEIMRCELSFLANVTTNSDIKQKLNNTKEAFDYSKYGYRLNRLSVTKDGKYLRGALDNWDNDEFLINTSNKNIIKNSNYKVKNIDSLGNIVVELEFGSGKKQCLLDCNGEVIIEFADKIEGPADGVYIVTNRGVKQCYLNGAPISYSAEQILLLDKHICDSKGYLVEDKKAIVFGNKGNYSIVDEEADIVLIQNDNTLKLKKMFDDIETLMLDENLNDEDEKGYEKRK